MVVCLALFGLVEIVILLVGVLVVVGVIAAVVVGSRGSRTLASGQAPTLPPAPAPAPAPDAAQGHAVVQIHAGSPLGAQLREHASAAESRGLRPFLELGAVWCPPSRMFGDVLDDPRMQAALAGIYLIRAELDDFGGDPLIAELRASAVPAFYELDADGSWTGRQINGGAWGADTVDNMANTMGPFFAS